MQYSAQRNPQDGEDYYICEHFDLYSDDAILLANLKRKARSEVSLKQCNPQEAPEFRGVLHREFLQWDKYEVLRVAKGAPKHVPPEEVEEMRWVFTRKANGSAKARAVTRGYQAKDLAKLKSAAPTASRRARNLFLPLAEQFGWKIGKGDVTAAFLQGAKSQAGRQAYVDPPLEFREWM